PHSFYGGFGNADALVIFPLTQSCALLMHGKEGSFAREQGDRGFVRKTNLRVASHCERFVVGRDGQLLRSLADSQGFLACSGWKPQRYVWSRKRPAKSFLYRAVATRSIVSTKDEVDTWTLMRMRFPRAGFGAAGTRTSSRRR